MTPYLRNVIRTAIPAIIGAATAYLAKHGLDTSSTTAMLVMPVATTAYYSAIRKLEEKWPKLSWLIGALPVNAEQLKQGQATVAQVETVVAKVEAEVKKSVAEKAPAAKKSAPKA